MITARVSILEHRSMTGTTVQISASPEALVAEVEEELRSVAPVDGPLYLDDKLLTDRETFADLDLRDGAIISVGAPAPPLLDREPHPGLDVLVAGGPDAGRVIALPYGAHEIGRDSFRSVALNDPEVSRNHAQLDITPAGATITDLGSANGTLVDGRTTSGPTPLAGGEYLRVGNTVLVVAAPEAADTALVRGADGTLTYNRRFRTSPDLHETSVEFPGEFEEEPPPATSLVYLVAPVIVGLVMALIMGPRFLVFAFLGPITGLAGMYASRRQHRTRQDRQRQKHDKALAKSNDKLGAALRSELNNRREAAPDLATLVRAARGPRRRLWERRPTDGDFLELRLGLANRPSSIELRGELAPAEPLLPDVPVTVSLLEAGSIGVAGDHDLAVGVARTLLFQVATLHSPSDVRIIVISSDAAWSWTRWLPHVRSGGESDRLLLGADSPSARARLGDLESLMAERHATRAESHGSAPVSPRFVVLLDHPSRLERHRVARILAEGPAVGVHAICIEDSEPELPEEHAGASVIPQDGRLFLRVRNRPTVSDVSEEIINLAHADLASRCLAPLRPESTSSASLPVSSRFLDVIGLQDVSARAIVDRWASSEGTCSAVVGVSGTGALAVTLDDRAPHGLVAGMSGSGKSEFLKTYLAGLAVDNHPDHLQFLLIDFKGGGDYRTLARLPHTVDLVTNIDDPDHAAVRRAISLLEAEVDRRQREVNAHGARDLATYRKVREADPTIPVIGRLLVVADEFGELASQRPELLENLVSVARIGRAMGVHLLLATQRPSGSITGQIQANVPMRICFRVNRGEAADVIGSDEPERIARTLAGRGYVRNGEEPAVEFQCARVANARPAVAAIVEPLQVTVESWSSIGHSRGTSEVRVEVADPDTDLWDVTESTLAAASALGWEFNPVPWPHPLPDSLHFSPNRAVVEGPQGRPAAVIGLRDDPKDQRHVPYSVLLGGGNVAIAGSPGSGRTTTLRTMAAALAYTAPPAHLHLHALDFAGGGLRSLRPLPHVGTITDDSGIATRLLDRLEEELEVRRSTFAASGWSNLAEQWSIVEPEDRSPAVVLIIDGWDSIAELPGSARDTSLADRIVRLLSDGASVGFQAMVAGDRSVASRQIGRQMAHRLVLRFNDQLDYQTLDVDVRSIPKVHLDGRALVPTGRGFVDQVQIAHVGVDASGPTQTVGLQTVGAHLSSVPVPAQHRAVRLAPLPVAFHLATALDSPDAPVPAAGSIPVCIGIGGDEAEPIWVDLAAVSPGLAIVGPNGSGRSTALATVIRCALNAGVPVIVGLNGHSPLSEFDQYDGVSVVDRWSDLTIEQLETLAGTGPALIVIDDADTIEPRNPAMQWILDREREGFRLVAAGTTSSWSDAIVGWIPLLRQSRHGLLLWPGSGYDGNALGLSAPIPPEQQFSRPPGRALWVVDDRRMVVQVPT